MNEIMTEYEYDDLNEALYEETTDIYKSDLFETLDEVKKLAQIILVSTPFMRGEKGYPTVDLNDSIRDVKDFFYDFDYDYGQRFENLLRAEDEFDGQKRPIMNFYRVLDSTQERVYPEQSKYKNSGVRNDGYLKIDYDNTLEDEFAIAHEVTHEFSQQYRYNSLLKNYLGETTSITMEMLLEDYLVEHNKFPEEEVLKNRKNRFINTYNGACTILIECTLIDLYKKNGYINEEIYKNYLNSLEDSSVMKKVLVAVGQEHLKQIARTERLQFPVIQNYVIGTVLACDLHHQITQIPEKKETLKTLIDVLGNSDFETKEDLEVLENMDIPVIKDGKFGMDVMSLRRLHLNYIDEVNTLNKVKKKSNHL